MIDNKISNLYEISVYDSGSDRLKYTEHIEGIYKLIQIKSISGYFNIPVLKDLNDINSLKSDNDTYFIDLTSGYSKVMFFYPESNMNDDHSTHRFMNLSFERFKFYSHSDYIYRTSVEADNYTINSNSTFEECFSYLLISVLSYKANSWLELCEVEESNLKIVFNKLDIDYFFIMTEISLVKVALGVWEVRDVV